MGRPGKLSEEQWATLFDLDRTGTPRVVLADRFGITTGTICRQARLRGRMKTQDGLAVDRRRRPAGGWAGDHVFSQSRSGMTPRRWGELLDRLNAGEAREALADDYGVHVASIAAAAKRYGQRKCDLAGAVWRPRGPHWPKRRLTARLSRSGSRPVGGACGRGAVVGRA